MPPQHLSGKKGYPDLSLADDAFKKYAAHPEAQTWLDKHPYPRTMLYAMHQQASNLGNCHRLSFVG
jgi:intracellular multiplication protein IcmP